MSLKTISVILITALLSYVALLFLPWWSDIVVTFIIIFTLPLRPLKAFIAGALGVGICWTVLAFIADYGNEHILSTKMSALFQLPRYWLMIAATSLIGCITGGLGGLAAGILRNRTKQPD